MGRGGVSAVVHGAKPFNAAAYEHILVEEQRREWERTKEDLGVAKKQIAEKDDLILQLKTQVRKLQETLQKKDKDVRIALAFLRNAISLQAVFAVLRAPQDAELTQKRKQELIDRLVMENQQRVVNAEAIAAERKKELDRLKYSSKFLRYQELEVELEEYRREIERLRAMSIASASSPRHSDGAVVGKLKLSAVLSDTTGTEGGVDRGTKSSKVSATKPHHCALARASSANSNTAKAASRQDAPSISDPRSTAKGKVLLVSTAKLADPARKKEGFVSKTRRCAQEAEYYKQVRLAQLEAECELEENIHIRATRKVKARLEAEKKSREQQREVAAIREEIAALQQLKVVPGEEETKQQQQQNNAAVVTLEVSGDTTTATPEQSKTVKKLELTTEEKGQPPSAGGSELSPRKAVGPVPDPAGEQEVLPVSSPTEEPIAQPCETSITGGEDDVKARKDPGLYESFSEDPKQQNYVPEITLKAEPGIVDTTDEATLAVGQREIEHANEDNGSEDEFPEEHDTDVEIEELSTKGLDSSANLATFNAADKPLEISGAEGEQEGYKSSTVAYGADTGAETKVTVENQAVKEPIDSSVAATVPNAAILVSDQLYDEEVFDDDPKGQEDESKQIANEAAEQHQQGFLVDVIDPHTKLAIPEATNELETHGPSAQEHRQGFLVDVVDPHSNVVIQDSEPRGADQETQQGIIDGKQSSELLNDPGSSVDDSPSRAEIAAESNSPDPSRLDTEETRSKPSAVDSAEVSPPAPPLAGAEDDEPSALESSKSSSDEPVLDSGVPSLVIQVEHEQPSQCFAQEDADAISLQTVSDGICLGTSAVRQATLVVESNEELQDEPKAEMACDDVIEKQIMTGVESVDHMSDSIAADESTSIMSTLHLTAAELENAMHAAARKIQQFWRQVDVRFRRVMSGESTSSNVTIVKASVIDAGAVVLPSEEEEKAIGVVKQEEKEEKEQVTVSGSEATSPSYTPYSTPRNTESDDQHSQSQDFQESVDDDEVQQQEQDV